VPTFEVTLEVEGVIYVTVEAEDEEAVVRRARFVASIGGGDPNLDFECVDVQAQVES
jgi:hypothetical protein